MWSTRALIFCNIIIIVTTRGVTLSEEKRLIKHMLENYKDVGIVGRPVFNRSEIVRVSFGLVLIQILDLDEYHQVLTTSTWHRLLWNDILLKWNPVDFGGVDHVRVPISSIWTPDIVLYNTPEDDPPYETRAGSAMAVVSSDGNVLWIPRKKMKSTCTIDLQFFPYDTQVCKLKFGSWTYAGFTMDVNFYANVNAIDLTDYINSNEWEVLEAPAKKNVKYYPCCEESFPDLTFTLKLRRISSKFQYSIIMPAVLLTILTFIIFLLPPTMDSKINMGIFVFAGDILLLLVMGQITPASTSIPSITAFLSGGLCVTTLALVMAVVTVNLAKKGKRGIQLPAILKKIFNDCIGCVLCVCSANGCGGNKKDKVNKQVTAERDWETFAIVLDRTLFIIILLVVIALGAASVN